MRTAPDLLTELNASDESPRIEAKRAREIGKSIMETVIAFANEPGLGGGYLLVANESGAGLTRVALDHSVPVANAILTVETEAQAWDRADAKGRDAARVAVEMANLLDTLA